MAVDKHSLQAMAERVAVAIERRRLQQEQAEHTAALHVLSELHCMSVQEVHPSKIWHAALHRGLNVLGCNTDHIRRKGIIWCCVQQ